MDIITSCQKDTDYQLAGKTSARKLTFLLLNLFVVVWLEFRPIKINNPPTRDPTEEKFTQTPQCPSNSEMMKLRKQKWEENHKFLLLFFCDACWEISGTVFTHKNSKNYENQDDWDRK